MEALLRRLVEAEVELVVVGGFAATAHGATRLTRDLDLCIPFTEPNLSRLLAALEGSRPRFRPPPAGVALPRDAAALGEHRNLYLETDLGELDCLSEIAGVGPFAQVTARSTRVTLWGLEVAILDLDALIDAKKALRRPKDLETLVELEALSEKTRGSRG